VLRRILDLKRGEVTQKWRKLHHEELHRPYSSSNITVINSRRIRPNGRSRNRWEDNIKLDLEYIL